MPAQTIETLNPLVPCSLVIGTIALLVFLKVLYIYYKYVNDPGNKLFDNDFEDNQSLMKQISCIALLITVISFGIYGLTIKW
jgi:hypothetical protein